MTVESYVVSASITSRLIFIVNRFKSILHSNVSATKVCKAFTTRGCRAFAICGWRSFLAANYEHIRWRCTAVVGRGKVSSVARFAKTVGRGCVWVKVMASLFTDEKAMCFSGSHYDVALRRVFLKVGVKRKVQSGNVAILDNYFGVDCCCVHCESCKLRVFVFYLIINIYLILGILNLEYLLDTKNFERMTL